jgi:arginine deiminase
VHRPGAELKRVLPRHARQLLFAGLPWAARAQQEHDVFTQVLRDHGVQVLYLTELLQDVLAVPLGHPDRRLDTICTMLNGDTVLMRPAVAYSLTARVLTPGAGGPRVSHPQAFLAAAAAAAGRDRLRVVETGFGPAGREQWDDAGNLLVLAPGLVVTHERNVATLARLERCGIESIGVPGSELCGPRGGPRSLCCPVSRDPAPLPAGLCIEL